MMKLFTGSSLPRIVTSVVAAGGLLVDIGATGALAGDVRACAADRPCILDLDGQFNGKVTGSWSGGWEVYHVIWSEISPAQGQETRDHVVTHPQAETKGTSATFTAANPSNAVRLSVQGCTKHIFSKDECSPWSSGEVILNQPYGSDTCKQGFVWRDAYQGDHTCVTPAARDQAASDNAQASARRQPGGAYGPDTCKNGFVWREARHDDHVCVTPAVREQTARDNALDNDRRVEARGFTSQG